MALHLRAAAVYALLACLAVCSVMAFRQSKVYKMDLETKRVITEMVTGAFTKPRRLMTSTEYNAYMRWYRHREHFSVREGVLFWKNRQVLCDHDFKSHVLRTYKTVKGSGSRKLFQRMAKNYTSLSEDRIHSIVKVHPTHRKLNAVFKDKPIVKSVTASYPHERLQIDLMDMGDSNSSLVNDKFYRYILTVLDVFSRFVWLFPLVTKASRNVAYHLSKLFKRFGKPNFLQSDRGGEFRKHVSKLCQRLGIKQIRSRPYHPQSQGKVERIHRTIRRKITFDNLTVKSNRWATKLKTYEEIINNESRRELGNHSPFEVYFGRLSDNEKKRVESVSKKINNDTIRRANKNIMKYDKGDHVLVKVRKGRSFKLFEGIVENIKGLFVTVRYDGNVKVFNVKDVTLVKKKCDRKKEHRAKFYIPMTRDNCPEVFRAQGFTVDLNPTPDGSCMFAAAADQLRNVGVERSSLTLRHDIVNELRDNRSRFAHFVSGSWEQYVEEMAKPYTFGDHLCLQALSDIFNVKLYILSTAGPIHNQWIEPASGGHQTLFFGHYPEDGGAHYLSLKPNHTYITEQSTDHEIDNSESGFMNNSDLILDDNNQINEENSHLDDELTSHDEGENSYTFIEEDSEVALRVPRSHRSTSNIKNITMLPNELLTKIFAYASEGNIVTKQYLKCVNKCFYENALNLGDTIVHLRPSVEDCLDRNYCVSMLRLSREAGRYSGLVKRLYELVGHRQRSSWLEFSPQPIPGQFVLKRVFWRR